MKSNIIYEKNLRALKKLSPILSGIVEQNHRGNFTFRVLVSESGVPTLEVSNKESSLLLHSRRDPMEEAKRFVNSHTSGTEQVVAVVGFGLGYHIEELIEANKTSTLLIIEPSLSIFSEALKTRDLSTIFLSERVLIISDSDFIKYEEVIQVPSWSNVKFLVLRPYSFLFKEEVAKIRNNFYSFLNRTEINTATMKRFDRLWTKNTFKNAPFFFTLSGLKKLKGVLRGIPAVVICAGPSLDDDLAILPRLQKNAFLIAVDTTVKPLLKRGIKPDFAITVDPQFINSFFMARIKSLVKEGTELPVLITDPAVYPTTLRNYTGIKVLTSSVFSPGKIIERFAGEKGSIAAGGSVSVAAFDLARIAEADPIILLGLDLSYSSGKTHFSGSFIETYILARVERFKGAQTFYAQYLREGSPSLITDKNGSRVFTDKRLLLYKSWFENQAPGTMATVLNASSGGLDIKGIKNIPLIKLGGEIRKRGFNRSDIEKKIAALLKFHETDLKKLTQFDEYLVRVQNNLVSLKDLSREAVRLSRELFNRIGGSQTKIKNDLDAIDKKILSFREENQLVSMVQQTAINDIISNPESKQENDFLVSSLKLYSSIEEGAGFLLSLIKLAKKKLRKLHSL